MIAPILPDAEKLVGILEGKVHYIILDRMNYHYADWIYKKLDWDDKKTDAYFKVISHKILTECQELGIDCKLAY